MAEEWLMVRSVLPRRNIPEWGLRILLASIVVGCAWYVVIGTLGYVLRLHSIDRAYILAPNDARISGIMSEKLSGPDADAITRASADQVAREALLRDPTNVAAVATLGLNAELRSEQPAAQRAFSYAQLLSRRDLRTQLWAIEYAVAKGDMREALRHYDIALRTSRHGPSLLFPVLGSAIADPSVRAALIRTLARHPGWQNEFIEYVAGSSPVPDAAARLLIGLQRSGVDVPPSAAASVINALIKVGKTGDAWNYYLTRYPGADRRRSRDGKFSGEIHSPSAFDWITYNENGRFAVIQNIEEQAVLDFYASPSAGGVVARQMQFLPPGWYVLRGKASGVNQPPESLPYWAVDCNEGERLASIEIPSSGEKEVEIYGTFYVPDACTLQSLSLNLKSSDSLYGVNGRVLSIYIYTSN